MSSSTNHFKLDGATFELCLSVGIVSTAKGSLIVESEHLISIIRKISLETHRDQALVDQNSASWNFSNEALQASEKGYERLMESYKTLQGLKPSTSSDEDIKNLQSKCYEAMNDDFNTSVLIAQLFDAVKIINSCNDGKTKITQPDIDILKKIYNDFVFDVLGLKPEAEEGKANSALQKAMALLLSIRHNAKTGRDFKLSDEIRDKLIEAGIQIKDTKEKLFSQKEVNLSKKRFSYVSK